MRHILDITAQRETGPLPSRREIIFDELNALDMRTLVRTNSDHPDFIHLVQFLDAELAIRDGDEHAFYAQYNKIDTIKYVVVAFDDTVPLGCGAIKEFSPDTMEVKRMYTLPEHRGKGIASAILTEIERWASELNFKKCILETGLRQPEAIALYEKNGYHLIPNYGQYAGMENSVCFEKMIAPLSFIGR